MVMTLKSKKLHPDNIQWIRGFVMTYKGLTIFTVTYKELAHEYLYTRQNNVNVIVKCLSCLMGLGESLFI
jgi:hypothetical protein